MSDQKPPKREFNPRSHAMIYLMAIVYLAYLIFQMVKGYLAGRAFFCAVSRRRRVIGRRLYPAGYFSLENVGDGPKRGGSS